MWVPVLDADESQVRFPSALRLLGCAFTLVRSRLQRSRMNLHRLVHSPLPCTLGVLLLAACEVPPRDLPVTGIELPERFLAGESGEAEDAATHWWISFQDPQLNACVEEAFRGNRNLRVFAHRFERSIAAAEVQGADAWPQISGSFQGLRQRINFLGFPFGSGSSGVASTTFNTFSLGLNLSWELDLWGRLRALERAALVDVQASEADLAGAFHSLAGQTVQAYLGAALARLQLENAGDIIAAYEGTLREVEDRASVGLAPQADRHLAAADLAAARATLAERRELLERRRLALFVLLGRTPDEASFSGADLPALPEPVPAGLPAELLRRRPDLAAAERRLVAASERRLAAEADLYPRLSLTASGGTSSEEVSDLLDGDFRVWSLAGNVLQPIFEGGRLRAQVRVRSAKERELLESFANLLLEALVEVEVALAVDQFLERREALLEEAVRESRAAMRLTEDRYREGLDALLPVLEAKRRVLDNESAFLTVRHARLINRVDLHLALGGGVPGPSLSNPSDETASR